MHKAFLALVAASGLIVAHTSPVAGKQIFNKRSDNYITPWNAPHTLATAPSVAMPEVYGQHVYQPPPMPKEGLHTELYHDLQAQEMVQDTQPASSYRRKKKSKQGARKLLEDQKGVTSDDEHTLVVEGLAPSPMEAEANWNMVSEEGPPYKMFPHDSLGRKIAGVAIGISTVGLAATTGVKVYMENLARRDRMARERAERREAQGARIEALRQGQEGHLGENIAATPVVATSATTSNEGSSDGPVLHKRGEIPITRWDPHYNVQQIAAVDMPDIYGQNAYQPPPLPRKESWAYSEYQPFAPPSIEEEDETPTVSKKKAVKDTKAKKGNRRGMTEYGTVNPKTPSSDIQGEVPAGPYGYRTGGPGSPYVCGPDADRTCGQYGGGGTTIPMGPHGYDSSGASNSGAGSCDGSMPSDQGGTAQGGNAGMYGYPQEGSSEMGRGSSHLGAGIAAAGVGTAVMTGGAYYAHRYYKNKKKQENDCNDHQDQSRQGEPTSTEMDYVDEQDYYVK